MFKVACACDGDLFWKLGFISDSVCAPSNDEELISMVDAGVFTCESAAQYQLVSGN